MGICNSCEATTVLPTTVSTATVKLVLPDGKLQELDPPVRASQAAPGGDLFVCNPDDMEVGGFPAALDGDEELQMGQLYFLLPSPALRRRLNAEEMARLAVRASSALVKARRRYGDGAQHRGAREEEVVIGDDVNAHVRRRSTSRRVSGKGRNFKPDLSLIPE